MATTDSSPARIAVEVVYALPERQTLLALHVPVGTTAQEAVALSGLLRQYPELDLAQHKLGLFGKVSAADTVLREGDRVEIYRPLLADPKEVRRRRVAEGKAMRKGGGEAG